MYTLLGAASRQGAQIDIQNYKTDTIGIQSMQKDTIGIQSIQTDTIGIQSMKSENRYTTHTNR